MGKKHLSSKMIAAIITLIYFDLSYGQQLFIIQEPNQPPAPDMGDLAVPAEVLLTSTKGLVKDLYEGREIPPDSLVAPDGRIVALSRRRKQKQEQRQKEEEERLIKKVIELDGKRGVSWRVCLWTLVGCACVVACGVIPAFIIPSDSATFLNSKTGRRNLHLLLSFAVGSIIGDVFLHLLPTIWADSTVDKLSAGIWTITGVLFCFILEKCCAFNEASQRKICAFLNLLANFMDNFTHGLAIGGSFLVEIKLGLITTFAIIIHELPHEISDFAILLRANFSKWSAIRAQLITAVGGALGAYAALFLHANYAATTSSERILPFTAGGFINIALAQILPEIMRETNLRQSILQWLTFLAGVAAMAIMSLFCIG